MKEYFFNYLLDVSGFWSYSRKDIFSSGFFLGIVGSVIITILITFATIICFLPYMIFPPKN